jgi:hypothetical protein
VCVCLYVCMCVCVCERERERERESRAHGVARRKVLFHATYDVRHTTSYIPEPQKVGIFEIKLIVSAYCYILASSYYS